MPTLTTDRTVFTYQDAIDRLLVYCNSNGQNNPVDAVRQAVLDTYESIVNDRNWTYLDRGYGIALSVPETGTLSYLSSTGEFTIDSGSWPTWAERAVIEIASVRYFIKTRSSSTVLIADDTLRPIADIVTGTDFTIYRCVYQLPWDFKRLYRPLAETDDTFVDPISFAEWFEAVRYSYSTAGALPWAFAVAADPYEPVRMALLIDPCGETDQTTDFAYQRFPRQLIYDGHATHCRVGTISAANTATVTGSSTTFESGMVGAILRYARSALQYPTGRGTANEYAQQEYIKTYSSATSIVLHSAITASANKYTVSDPIDLDRTLMDAFWRGCEAKLASRLKFPNAEAAYVDYQRSMTDARGGDKKSSTNQSAWGPRGGRGRYQHRTIVQFENLD